MIRRVWKQLTALTLALTSLMVHAEPAAQSPWAAVPGGTFESVLPPAPTVKQVTLPKFYLDRTPVTNAQFAAFLKKSPEWRRDRVARVFADEQYLSHWEST